MSEIKLANQTLIIQVVQYIIRCSPNTFQIVFILNFLYSLLPVLTPWLYTPSAPLGQRFTTGLASTTIGRLYHSSASLLPDGSVIM